jgi:hypothetical protein
MRTKSSHTAQVSERASCVASDPAIQEIDAYVLGLRVHVRLSRSGRPRSEALDLELHLY